MPTFQSNSIESAKLLSAPELADSSVMPLSCAAVGLVGTKSNDRPKVFCAPASPGAIRIAANASRASIRVNFHTLGEGAPMERAAALYPSGAVLRARPFEHLGGGFPGRCLNRWCGQSFTARYCVSDLPAACERHIACSRSFAKES